MKRLITVVVATLAITATGISGCAFDPSSVPVPGTSVSGPTYRLDIEFANTLNLPARAKVMANGVRVGTVHSVTVVDPASGNPGYVSAAIDIQKSVRLPVDTTAQLRQNTILGDIFIGLTIPTTPVTRMLAPGSTIPIQRTQPPLQIEDLLAGLSTFVTGGAIQRFQDIVDSTNSILPDQPRDTARIFGTIGQNARDLATHLDTIDRFLGAVQQDMRAVLDNPKAIDDLLSEKGASQVPADANSLVLTLGLIGGLGIVGHAVAWLAPFLRASDSAAKALVPLFLSTDHPLDLTAPSNLNGLVKFLRDKLIPFGESPAVNIGTISTEDAGQAVPADVQIDSVIATLRMIGVVR
ncbi:MCE family protein [Nocardia sp. BSTN01]|uniref:MlaD family protein n=1 Tax=Nocardia sp. BSTN01 TaxID=2783665 RepID=UPI00188FF1E0|nr:MlaD family protein [Nocardia sp. BSTN01]MBF5000521.1 MCE family protein [Nocardia sp. BSTN01]